MIIIYKACQNFLHKNVVTKKIRLNVYQNNTPLKESMTKVYTNKTKSPANWIMHKAIIEKMGREQVETKKFKKVT